MPVLRPRREALVEPGLRPRFAPVVRVLRLLTPVLAALLRVRLAPLLLVVLRPRFATARARVVFALARVERVFDAAALGRPAVFLRPPAFAAGRPRLAPVRFAPAFAVRRVLLLAAPALRPRLAPALARRPRAAPARLPRRRWPACSPAPCPCELISPLSSSSKMTDSITLDWSSQGMVISCRSPQLRENTGSVAGVPNFRSEITQR